MLILPNTGKVKKNQALRKCRMGGPATLPLFSPKHDFWQFHLQMTLRLAQLVKAWCWWHWGCGFHPCRGHSLKSWTQWSFWVPSKWDNSVILSQACSVCFAYVKGIRKIVLVCAEREGVIQAWRLMGKQTQNRASRRKVNQQKKATPEKILPHLLSLWKLYWKMELQPFLILLSLPSPQWYRRISWFYILFWICASHTIVILSRLYRSAKKWRLRKTPVGQELILAAMSD